MKEIETLDVKIINVKKYMILVLFYVIGGIYGSIFLALHLRIEVIMFIGFFVFGVLPFIFLKKFRKPFVKKSVITLSKTSILIQIFDNATGDVKEENEYLYQDIKSYFTTEAFRDHSSFLKIYFKDGSNRQYSFVEQKINDESDIIYRVKDHVKIYNEDNPVNGRIELQPTFFSTKVGRHMLGIIGLLWLATTIILIIYSRKH
ncbi:hypothetical protein [Pedobacter sp. L105]|uniref:hypothetical protein n=1 Tax=Pedobacter sp. L105 TaxID=1641871 RepID=UPI00131CDB61|nr:hypothetical protein [Pedobacter sp. L105]